MKSNTKIFLFAKMFLFCIGYVIIKDSKDVKVYSVNPSYLIFAKMNGYFEEINGNKYLILKQK